ncbi:MAG: hypothetical protein PHQ22_03490 [Sulfuricurvum sp.]|nr:hypothetical protein [Sulfuricurvum sp.]MDD5386237.1 hypothetical protein [Sulfuricurvum sp.]
MLINRALPFTVLLIGRIYAAGGPPIITDDPETPGNGNLEVNVAYKGDIQANTLRYEQPIIDINYGVGENIQLKVESSYVSLFRDGESHTQGIGNTKIGVKWRFYENSAGNILISTYPQYTFVPIKKNYHNGIADIDQALFLPIEISKKIGTLAVTGEFGYLSIKGSRDQIEYGAVVGYEVLEHLELLAELHNASALSGGNTTMIANGGLKYWISSYTSFLFSSGRELISPESSKAALFYAGLQLRY